MSPRGTPLTVRPTSVDPSAVLVAVVPLPVLLAIATTSLAVTSPLRPFSCSTVALLWALAVLAPIAPLVMTCRVSEATAPGTLRLSTSFSTMPPSGGKTTSGVLGTTTGPTLAETPKASPLTLFTAFTHACAAAVRKLSKNMQVERLTIHRAPRSLIRAPPSENWVPRIGRRGLAATGPGKGAGQVLCPRSQDQSGNLPRPP